MNPTNSELKACPLCGGRMMFRKALWPSDGCTDAVIHAEPTDCGMVVFDTGTTDESVIAAWNTRKSEALADDAVERAAEDWMHKRFAPDHPNDCDYDADEMIDAFMAGAALSTLTPSPAVDLLREVEDAMAQALAKDDVRPLIGPYARLGAALKEAK